MRNPNEALSSVKIDAQPVFGLFAQQADVIVTFDVTCQSPLPRAFDGDPTAAQRDPEEPVA